MVRIAAQNLLIGIGRFGRLAGLQQTPRLPEQIFVHERSIPAEKLPACAVPGKPSRLQRTMMAGIAVIGGIPVSNS
jgi:hypothetical protein